MEHILSFLNRLLSWISALDNYAAVKKMIINLGGLVVGKWRDICGFCIYVGAMSSLVKNTHTRGAFVSFYSKIKAQSYWMNQFGQRGSHLQ